MRAAQALRPPRVGWNPAKSQLLRRIRPKPRSNPKRKRRKAPEKRRPSPPRQTQPRRDWRQKVKWRPRFLRKPPANPLTERMSRNPERRARKRIRDLYHGVSNGAHDRRQS